MSTPSPADRRVLAGHVLRRAGFGPSAADMRAVLDVGAETWIERQLDPASVDDSAAQARFLPEPSRHDYYPWRDAVYRWMSRMQFSRRQLLERMTLVWHEHFATSNDKVRVDWYSYLQEATLRRYALGSFPKLLAAVARDQAMLVWLDNDRNDGKARAGGMPVPPNENFARELLQVFATGTTRLAMDGTPVLDAGGEPEPNYSEQDVREIARAVTGWRTGLGSFEIRKARFDPSLHDSDDKTIFGERVPGRRGADGAREIEDVVAAIMRHPSTAPFVSKELIQRIATETPTPGYVERVATVFENTDGDIKQVVRAILLDAEFTSDDVVRTQHRTPVELLVGAVRGLDAALPPPDGFLLLLKAAGQLPYYPPTVFGFYRPGDKASLVDTARVGLRDRVAHEVVREREGGFDPSAFASGLGTAEAVVDALADRLLAAPLSEATRATLVDYMAGRTTDDAVRGAAWLLLCSPDYHRY